MANLQKRMAYSFSETACFKNEPLASDRLLCQTINDNALETIHFRRLKHLSLKFMVNLVTGHSDR